MVELEWIAASGVSDGEPDESDFTMQDEAGSSKGQGDEVISNTRARAPASVQKQTNSQPVLLHKQETGGGDEEGREPNLLLIRVIKGDGLIAMDTGYIDSGKSDPHVTLMIDGTSVKEQTTIR